MKKEEAAASPEMQGAAELVRRGETVIRVENETMQAVAIARPRDVKVVLKAALEELEIAPEFAEKAFYSLPFRDEGDSVQVEGISFPGSAALARLWGNCVVDARAIAEDEDGVDFSGVFIDLETNFRIGRPYRASRWRKTRKGTYRLDDRGFAQECGIAISKAERNATLAGMPPWLRVAYFNRAREIAGGGKLDKPAPEKKVEAAVAYFREKHGVALDRIEAKVGKPRKEWTGLDLANLRGIINEINDHQTTVEAAFAAPAAEAAPGPFDSLKGGKLA